VGSPFPTALPGHVATINGPTTATVTLYDQASTQTLGTPVWSGALVTDGAVVDIEFKNGIVAVVAGIPSPATPAVNIKWGPKGRSFRNVQGTYF
jgi:hypothetical protein